MAMGDFEKWHPVGEFENEAILDASQQTLDSIKDLEGCCASWPAEFLQPINHLSVAAAEMLECVKADVRFDHQLSQLDDLISQIIGVTMSFRTGQEPVVPPNEPMFQAEGEPASEKEVPDIPNESSWPLVQAVGKENEGPADEEPDSAAGTQTGTSGESTAGELHILAAAEPVGEAHIPAASGLTGEPLILAVHEPAGTAVRPSRSKPAAHLILPSSCEPAGEPASHKASQPPRSKRAPSGLSAQLTAKSAKVYRKTGRNDAPERKTVPDEKREGMLASGIICSPNLRISGR
jgi:hypothetical protein